MIDIPPQVRIKSTIRAGSVYPFTDPAFVPPTPHFFIVLNAAPRRDEVLLLLCPSSRLENVKRRRAGIVPPETLVEIQPGEYGPFDKPTIVDCNQVHKKPLDDIVKLLECGSLQVRPDLPGDILTRLREASLLSPLLSEQEKRLIRPE